MAWVEESGTIPDEYLGYGVQEETTDGKLSALIYTPTYTSPIDEKETSGSAVRVTDSALLSKYQAAKADNPDTAYDVVKPAMSLSGTYYRQTSGKDPVASQAYEKVQSYYDKMKSACSKYKGAQYSACMRMVEAKAAQMQSKIPGFAKGGMVNGAQDMMNKNYYADGGEVGMAANAPSPEEMQALMDNPQASEPSVANAVDRIASNLTQEETNVLDMALNDYPQLITILDKAELAIGTGAAMEDAIPADEIGMANEFTEDGKVSGPGTGTSDSIPARLSDGEFVVTAKAVKQIGVDKLRKMMEKAEKEYDNAMYQQEAKQMEDTGYAIGGLLDQARKQYANMESAVAEYQQPMEMQQPTNVNGMGQQMPAGEVGMMAQRTIDMNRNQPVQQQRQEANTNVRSADAASMMNAQSMETAADRAAAQEQLVTGAQEEEQDMGLMSR